MGILSLSANVFYSKIAARIAAVQAATSRIERKKRQPAKGDAEDGDVYYLD